MYIHIRLLIVQSVFTIAVYAIMPISPQNVVRSIAVDCEAIAVSFRVARVEVMMVVWVDFFQCLSCIPRRVKRFSLLVPQRRRHGMWGITKQTVFCDPLPSVDFWIRFLKIPP